MHPGWDPDEGAELTILAEILERKRGEVAAAKRKVAPEAMAERAVGSLDPTRGFRAALLTSEPPAVIAEVKRRSPSKGEIRADFDPVVCAREYAANAAAAISVLTDEHYFGGHLEFLSKIRAEVPQPLLRKDFTVDPYQIDEARVHGADAVLLIAAALSPDELASLREYALALDLDALVEVHDEAQLDTALEIGADLIGVNNRNLETFVTDLAVTERLARRIEDRLGVVEKTGLVLVAESGIAEHADIERLQGAGAQAFLVGESLMRQADLGAALRRLRLGEQESRR